MEFSTEPQNVVGTFNRSTLFIEQFWLRKLNAVIWSD